MSLASIFFRHFSSAIKAKPHHYCTCASYRITPACYHRHRQQQQTRHTLAALETAQHTSQNTRTNRHVEIAAQKTLSISPPAAQPHSPLALQTHRKMLTSSTSRTATGGRACSGACAATRAPAIAAAPRGAARAAAAPLRVRSIPVPKDAIITRTDSEKLADMEERFRMADIDK